MLKKIQSPPGTQGASKKRITPKKKSKYQRSMDEFFASTSSDKKSPLSQALESDEENEEFTDSGSQNQLLTAGITAFS